MVKSGCVKFCIIFTIALGAAAAKMGKTENYQERFFYSYLAWTTIFWFISRGLGKLSYLDKLPRKVRVIALSSVIILNAIIALTTACRDDVMGAKYIFVLSIYYPIVNSFLFFDI